MARLALAQRVVWREGGWGGEGGGGETMADCRARGCGSAGAFSENSSPRRFGAAFQVRGGSLGARGETAGFRRRSVGSHGALARTGTRPRSRVLCTVCVCGGPAGRSWEKGAGGKEAPPGPLQHQTGSGKASRNGHMQRGGRSTGREGDSRAPQ